MIRPHAKHWLLAISFSVMLYLVAVTFFLWHPVAPTAASNVGIGGIEIGLGLSGSAPVFEPELASDLIAKEAVQQFEPRPVLKPQPETKQTLEPKDKPKLESEAKRAPAKTQSEPFESLQSQIDGGLSKPATAAGIHSSQNADSSDKPLDGGQVGNKEDYMQKLQIWLERHKEYPRRAKRRRQQGTVILYFAMDRQGTVIRHEIRQSSGHKLLDKEVAKMLERAQPLPAMPASISGNQMELIVPVQFVLR